MFLINTALNILKTFVWMIYRHGFLFQTGYLEGWCDRVVANTFGWWNNRWIILHSPILVICRDRKEVQKWVR